MKRVRNQKGFLRLIIIILVSLIVLSYIGVNVRDIVYSPGVTKVLRLIWDLITLVFDLFVTIIKVSWDTIITSLHYLKNAVAALKTS